MDQKTTNSVRKHPRLKEYDYSSAGRYFITICTQNKKKILSRIDAERGSQPVDAPARTCLTDVGTMVKEELLKLTSRYQSLTIDKYVIMPNHIHAIFTIITMESERRRSTIMDMICAFKSLSSRRYKAAGNSHGLWQTSFYEHVIRNEQDYLDIWQYIDNNPAKWADDEYF